MDRKKTEGDKSKIKWQETAERFVVFLDIMGFKDLVVRNEHSYVKELMRSFYRSVKAVKNVLETDTKSGDLVIRPVVFSDSILLVSHKNSLNDLRRLLTGTSYLVREGIAKGIPIKGCLSYGKQTDNFDEDIHVGMPIIDAYELQNELQLYGVVLHHTAESYISNNFLTSFINWAIKETPTPMKCGTITHYQVNWPTLADESKIDREATIKGLQNISSKVSGYARKYVDNTRVFVDSCCTLSEVMAQ